MQASRLVWTISLLALCLCTVWLLWRARIGPGMPPRPLRAYPAIPLPQSPSAVARWEASRAWTRAREAAAQKLETLEAWDSSVGDDPHREEWLCRLMAGDPHGDLQRAYSAAARAANQARTPQERFAAALLLSRIDCDLGRHTEELEQARLLMRLAPRNVESLGVLQRAAGHNGMGWLVKQASAQLASVIREQQKRSLSSAARPLQGRRDPRPGDESPTWLPEHP
jgi:hypothetical protein